MTVEQLRAIARKADFAAATVGLLALGEPVSRATRSRVELVAETLEIEIPKDFWPVVEAPSQAAE